MTSHLSPQEVIDVLEGAPSAAQERHLEACASCREQVDQFRMFSADLKASETLPEPSPLFWDRLSDRVRVATGDQVPAPEPWWLEGWRPLGALFALAAAVLLVVLVHPPGSSLVGTPVGSAVVSPLASTDDGTLTFVAQVAARVTPDDLQSATRPTADATDAMVEQLTQGERAELVRLLTVRMQGGE